MDDGPEPILHKVEVGGGRNINKWSSVSGGEQQNKKNVKRKVYIPVEERSTHSRGLHNLYVSLYLSSVKRRRGITRQD